MKKLIIIIIVTLTFFLLACSSPPTTVEKQTPTAEETKYVEEISEIISSWSVIFKEKGRILSEGDAFFNDYEEGVNLAMALLLEEKIIESAREIEPPDEYKEIHAVFVLAVDELEKSHKNLVNGIKNKDGKKIYEAIEQIEKGTVLIEKTAKMIGDRIN